MFKVHVKLFANLGDCYPELPIGQAMPVEVPQGMTVGQLAEKLELPSFKLTIVNGIVQKDDFVLNSDDEVAFIPPMGGG